jgi:hypothetical protein
MRQLLLFSFSLFCLFAKSQKLEFCLNDASLLKKEKVKGETYYGFFSDKDSAVYCINNYDYNGRLISSKTFSKKGKAVENDTLIYGINNLLAQKLIYVKKRKLKSIINYMYNQEGNIVSSKEFDDKKNLLYQDTCIYNQQGLLTLVLQKTNDTGRLQSQKIFYNINKQIQTIIEYQNFSDSSIVSYLYNNDTLKSINTVTKTFDNTESYKLNSFQQDDETTIIQIDRKSGERATKKMKFKYNVDLLCCERITSSSTNSENEKTKCYYTYYR